MGSEIIFGSRKFGAFGRGQLSKPENNSSLRYSADSDAPQVLISGGSSVSSFVDIPAFSINQLITIDQIYIESILFDSSAAININIPSEYVYLRPDNQANSDSAGGANYPFFAGAHYNVSLGMKVNFYSANIVRIYYAIAGGTVENFLNLTLGAGDQVTTRITIAYYS